MNGELMFPRQFAVSPQRENMHAYCLYCETKRAEEIAAFIQKDTGYRCLSPQIIQRKWVKGEPQEVRHRWLPGYIFIYTDEPITPEFRYRGVIRCLGRDELSGGDLKVAEAIYRSDGIIGIVRLAEVGDRCKVDDPAWAGFTGTVIKLDRGRKRCCISFEFDKVMRNVWVGYEMVIPADGPTT